MHNLRLEKMVAVVAARHVCLINKLRKQDRFIGLYMASGLPGVSLAFGFPGVMTVGVLVTRSTFILVTPIIGGRTTTVVGGGVVPLLVAA